MASSMPALKLFRGAVPGLKYTVPCYVNKLEAILRYNHIPYTQESVSPFAAPRGKVPYIQLPSSPTPMGDSHLILQHLVKTGVMPDPNSSLTALQRAHEVAIRSLIEDKLYFLLFHACWMIPANFYVTRDTGPLSVVPYAIRIPLTQFIYTRLRLTLYGQGTSRYTTLELAAILNESLDAISGLLSLSRSPNKTGVYWALGSPRPTELDGSLSGFLVSVLVSPGAGWIREALKKYEVLMDYATRIHEEYFSEFEKWAG